MIKQHQWALITGASSGIGEVFALEMASKGNHVVLVARTESKLEQLAERIKRTYQVRAEVVVSDLSELDAPQKVYEECQKRGIQIDILINNAGFATHGYFEQLPGSRQQDEITLNVLALTNMTHLFLPNMLEKENGTVINVASTAAFQPDPFMAVYGATKAFVLSFTEALYEENRKRGVQFLALCPGSTETPFFDVVGADEASVGKRDTPEHVVAVAVRALEKGKPYAVPGARNYWTAQFSRLMPRKSMLRIVGSMLRPRF
ncbi:SDR family oxidoreductase [Paenibacillus sp. RRE4]|uniref:SDR family NAD(P)-dependent oxidoreductase n=1 Tax=Paenibacillus sp. RRE4 TaxID=2962587 RepID=UPI00288215FA|nr:SDR family oxidoreductase [Paenibacillus sp. RRE4]MDT0124759.1 SDR family oxidoreductase [Paenibacillus sp. RRE4]